MGTRYYIRWYLALTLIGVLPILSVTLAGLIATVNGCVLHEGGVSPCLIMGHDFGGALHTMTVLGWLMLITNFALLAGVLGLVWEGVKAVFRAIFNR